MIKYDPFYGKVVTTVSRHPLIIYIAVVVTATFITLILQALGAT